MHLLDDKASGLYLHFSRFFPGCPLTTPGGTLFLPGFSAIFFFFFHLLPDFSAF